MILSKAFAHSRASEFYSQFFKPRFESFQREVKRTPLVIMLWGPRQRTLLWSVKRAQIRDTLRRLGHTVFFSEQLGVPIAAITKRGVEFLQRETADAIVALQSSYDAIGAVQHFSEWRVVDFKMLLFVDAAAPDERLYHRALEDLRTRCNNVETFKFPDDVTQDNLTIKIVEKINVIQMVKYCAIHRAHDWRLNVDAASAHRAQSSAELRPFHFNLLELYLDHREEVDVLTDWSTLFVLAYANYVGRITVKALAHQVGLAEATLQGVLASLLRSGMMAQQNDVVGVTGSGRRVLEGAGLVGMAAPQARPWAQAIRLSRVSQDLRQFGVALATVLLFFALMFYWSNMIQNQLPLQYTPTPPAVTRTTTATVTPVATPSPTLRR